MEVITVPGRALRQIIFVISIRAEPRPEGRPIAIHLPEGIYIGSIRSQPTNCSSSSLLREAISQSRCDDPGRRHPDPRLDGSEPLKKGTDFAVGLDVLSRSVSEATHEAGSRLHIRFAVFTRGLAKENKKVKKLYHL